MTQVICPAPQATLEQLLLEVSAGISLDEAARVLGIPASTALHIMQQHEMEARVLNLVSVWTDAQFKLLAEESPPRAASNQIEGESNVVNFSAHARLR